jgi:cysteine synthase A
MFARNALRVALKPANFHALRASSTISVASIDAMNPHGIEISKAQRVAEDGFVSGATSVPDEMTLQRALTDLIVWFSNWQHALD